MSFFRRKEPEQEIIPETVQEQQLAALLKHTRKQTQTLRDISCAVQFVALFVLALAVLFVCQVLGLLNMFL